VILDCEPPSWLMLSGLAARLTVVAAPDGPVSAGGSSALFTVHAVSAMVASAAARVLKAFMD
jgi:hypothetical protein